ncbi:uncharacterized protein LOC131929216 [Physella acuta]|uniref:uncharacterized protein LOC131929216 n=1 Tax=Physella acuta TaxID=109671 RepID=UPI0027DEA4FB|nr:uncharacterized protein LOC131929216 [Physella acuta]
MDDTDINEASGSTNLNNDEVLNNPTSSIPAVLRFCDVGYLDFDKQSKLSVISQRLRTEMIAQGSLAFQNRNAQFATSSGRCMTQVWFQRKLANGEEVSRSWLLYSPLKEAAYCFCCLLFTSSTPNSQSSFESVTGFKNWRHTERVRDHENSPSHRAAFTTWKEAERRIVLRKGIDVEVEAQIQVEKQRWRDVLKRLLSCIKFLASQNLALRGHQENLSPEPGTNVGNFLSLLTLVAQYDQLLANHLQHAQQNPGAISYLSPEIQNEFLSILASTVRNQLLKDIRKNKYFGILLDTTPDLAHREQLSEVIRYVDVDFVTKKVTIKESFLGFVQVIAKDAASIEKAIVDKLESDDLPLADCRSQCYDNASVMAGHISGLQQRMLKRNCHALFVNCDNHSLNLAGVYSAKQDFQVVTFFDTIRTIYNFFSCSTIRWNRLTTALPITVKRESDTRWCARAESVKAVYKGLDELISLLEELSEDSSQTSETRSEANTLLANVLSFNFFVLLFFWNKVLGKIDRVQKRLQDPTMNFSEAAADLVALETELNRGREELCQKALESAKTKCEHWGVEISRRIRRRKLMPGEVGQDVSLTAEEEIVRVMKSAIDRFREEVAVRFTRLKDLNEKFGFLLDVNCLLKSDLTNKDSISQKCKVLGEFYKTDFNGSELWAEICDCRMLLGSRSDALPKNPFELLSFIISYGNDVFPNLRIALQILLTISVSIASCERSFSKLKLILSYLRSSMGQDRLSDLAILSVEKETLNSIDFDDIIDKFASLKSRKINLL